MGFRAIRKLFDQGSVCVTGMRGTGKDMLMANVAVRKPQHISNIPYGEGYIPLDFDKLDCHNDNHSLVANKITPYVYPYPEGVDIYVSDIGIYFPSQFNDYLNKRYAYLPIFLALSRQLGKGTNVHCNVQSINRAWKTYKEQSDIFLRCRWCKVLFGGRLVIQDVISYDKLESCEARADPFWYPPPPTFAVGEALRIHTANKKLAYQRYRETHGNVKRHILIYRNKANYDTYHFRTIMTPKETPSD